MNQTLSKRLVDEATGTAMLLTAIVGSGIMGERLAAGNIAVALLANSIATGAALAALILNVWSNIGRVLVPAHLMFELPMFFASRHARTGIAQVFSEFLATFGLVTVIFGCARSRLRMAIAVAAYIAGAYWFTASTSFANPA